jgi:hypothetical protein
MSDLGAVLDVAIGLSFMYVMTSLLVTIVQEQIATLMQLRARNLFGAIGNLIADPVLLEHPEYRNLAVDLYRHPLMQSLYRQTPLPAKITSDDFVRLAKLPSYIPSRHFAVALLDVLRGKSASEAIGMDHVLAGAKEAVGKLPACQLKTTLTLFVADVDPRRAGLNERARVVSERVEGWFNDAMSRTSGWYKRQAQKMSLAIGLVLAVLINANTFEVAGQLWRDNALRAQVSATATAYYKEQTAAEKGPAPGSVAPRETQTESVAARWNNQMQSLHESSLPIGWKADVASMLPKNTAGWIALLFGWLVTALATSLGAAFWFDVLGRALQIRGSGPRIAESAPAPRPMAVAAAAAIEPIEGATSATVAVAGGGD